VFVTIAMYAYTLRVVYGSEDVIHNKPYHIGNCRSFHARYPIYLFNCKPWY